LLCRAAPGYVVGMSKQIAAQATLAIVLVAGAVLFVLIAVSPHRFLYDEAPYANYVTLLQKHGFTTEFMNSLSGSAGPLHGFVQALFAPLTDLQPVGMRFVNFFLLLIVAGILVGWLRHRGSGDAWAAALSILAMPMTWVLGGMALTEIPAMLFVTLSLYLQLRGLEALSCGRPVLGWFLTAAVALGIAVWGRQPYLLLAGVPCLLAMLDRRLWVSAAVFVSTVVAFAVPMFLIWKGLVPPDYQSVTGGGVAPMHALNSLGYIGVVFLLLAPQPRWLPLNLMAGIVILAGIVNALFGSLNLYPLRSIIDRYLSPSVVAVYGNLCGSLFISIGLIFLAWALWTLWRSRADLILVAIISGLLCVALSTLFISQGYSSRYTAMSLPYLVLATQAWRRWTMLNVITVAAGCGFGFLSLASYYFV
jgi:hypothetical protein